MLITINTPFRILYALFFVTSLFACNNGSANIANNQPSAVNSVNSSTQLGATIRENELDFSDDSLLPLDGVFFSEISHNLTDNQPYAGISQLSNGIIVHAGRQGSTGPATWLKANFFAGINSPERDTYNFAIIGDLKFNYKPNAQSYICKRVALAQYSPHLSLTNVWELFSNLPPGFAAEARDEDAQNISCINQASGQSEIFSVAGHGHTNLFSITQEALDQAPGVLDDAKFGQLVLAAYNSIPLWQRLLMYSNNIYNLTQYNPRNFLAFNPQRLLLNFASESSLQESQAVASDGGPIFMGVNPALNCSDIQQTSSTSAFSQAVQNSVTTTTTDTLGGGLALEWIAAPIADLTMGKIVLSVNYSHSWQDSQTTSVTQTYTASPQAVLLPPRSKIYVTVQLNRVNYSGDYKFFRRISGTIGADAILFPTDPADFLIYFSNANSGVLNLYEVLANSPLPLGPQIQIDPITKQIHLLGGGHFNASLAGSDFTVTFSAIQPVTRDDCPQSQEQKGS